MCAVAEESSYVIVPSTGFPSAVRYSESPVSVSGSTRREKRTVTPAVVDASIEPGSGVVLSTRSG